MSIVANKNYYTVAEATELLGMTEKEVLNKVWCGYIGRRVEDGKTLLDKDSVHKFANRYNIDIKEKLDADLEAQHKFITFYQASKILGTENKVHELVQQGKARQISRDGKYLVSKYDIDQYIKVRGY